MARPNAKHTSDKMTQKHNRVRAGMAVTMCPLEKLDDERIRSIADSHGLAVVEVRKLVADKRAKSPIADATIFDSLERPITEEPLFIVEAPDDRKDLSELERQRAFVSFMRKKCPHMLVCAIPNAAKRGQKAMNQARAEGMVSGAFDTFVAWEMTDEHPRSIAFLEWKGFDAQGRAGQLSNQQIDFGNSLHRKGHAVGCFFSARTAINWLREMGAPIQGGSQ